MKEISRRDMLMATAGTGLAAFAAPLLGCSTSVAAENVVLRVPIGPTPVKQMGQTVYGYELHIGKALSLGLTVAKVEILADGALVKTYEGAELSQCIIKKIDPFSADEAIFTGRDYQVLFAWPVMSAAAPIVSQFSHRVYFTDGLYAEGGAVAVKTGTTLIGPPVKGDRWWAANGPSNFDRHHRSCLIDIQFSCTIAQRFAIDWMQFGLDGRIFTGDGARCTDYHCYGADLLAVAAGTVIEARDGIPEGVPPNNYAATTVQHIFGNCVILDIGGGRYAAYAHIIPGTVKVGIGDTVVQGQVLGNLGNSGNSTAPHLHFHLCNGRDGLDSEGLPFSFAQYDLLGSMPIKDIDDGKAWTDPGTPQTRTAEMPLLDQVLKLY